MHLNFRTPILPVSASIVYEPALLRRRTAFAIFTSFFFICACFSFLLGANQLQQVWQTNATAKVVSLNTAHMAMTQTAKPTKTITLTPTKTFTPTPSLTPTITFTPTAAPEINWSKGVPVDNNGRSGTMLSLNIGHEDQIYAAYFEDANDDLRVAKFVNDGWQVDRLTNVVNIKNGKAGWWPSIAIGKSGIPHLIYFDWDTDSLRYINLFTPGKWSSPKTLASNVKLIDAKLNLDQDDTVYFAYMDSRQEGVYVGKSSSSNLITEKIDSFGTISRGLSGSALDFVLDQNNHAYLVYSTDQGLKFAWKNNVTWQVSNLSSTGLYPSLAIDTGGGLHVVYYDNIEQELVYSYLGPGTEKWSYSVIDSDGNVGTVSSVFIDSLGLVHVSYYDATNLTIKYAVGNKSGWSKYTVTKVNGAVTECKLVIDTNNVIHIVYFDRSVERLRYVKGVIQK